MQLLHASVLCAAVVLTACANTHVSGELISEMPPAVNNDNVMVGMSNRLTVYYSDHDAEGKSHCVSAECLHAWPPVYARASDRARGDFSIVERSDGRRQWALMGKPLYYSSADQRPGDVLGEGAEAGVWHVYRVPAGGRGSE